MQDLRFLKRFWWPHQRGASMVETAITVPLFFFLVLLIIDTARLFMSASTLNWVAYDTVNYASKIVVEQVTTKLNCDPAGCSPNDSNSACVQYMTAFNLITQRALSKTSLVASTTSSMAELIPFEHFRASDYVDCQYDAQDSNHLGTWLPPTTSYVAFIRPGERVWKMDGSSVNGVPYEHPTRPRGTDGSGEGWPKAGESWSEVLERNPLIVKMALKFKPITPFLPTFDIPVVQMAYRNTRKFGIGQPPAPLQPTATNTSAPTYTFTITPIPQPTFTETPANTSTITPIPSPTDTPQQKPTELPTYTPSITPTPSLTYTPSLTPTITQTFTPSLTSTITPTFTSSLTPTVTATGTETGTPTKTFTPSLTPTSSMTPTFTVTPTETRTPTPTATATSTGTVTRTATPSPTTTFPPTATPACGSACGGGCNMNCGGVGGLPSCCQCCLIQGVPRCSSCGNH